MLLGFSGGRVMSMVTFLFLLYIYGKGISVPDLWALVVAIFYVGDCILIKDFSPKRKP